MQNTSQLLMIAPVNFGYNAATAVNNAFQKDPGGDIQQKALEEFNSFVTVLRNNKIDVIIAEDTPEPATPDSIFPNNWISFHDDAQLFLYPMFAVNRRQERKATVLDTINKRFVVDKINDLTKYEKEDLFLEGTGSMVLDRVNKIAYACISARTDIKILNEFCNMVGYTPVSFNAVDNGQAIYHTNVMMCIADAYAVICLDTIVDATERKKVEDVLTKTGKEIIEISIEQMHHFAGNMLQLINKDDELLLVMSTQAYQSLTGTQIVSLRNYNRLIHSSLQTIEAAGGGSARCMMAEVFLQPK